MIAVGIRTAALFPHFFTALFTIFFLLRQLSPVFLILVAPVHGGKMDNV